MLRFAHLQSCMPKDIYWGLAWINGEGQEISTILVECRAVWGSTGFCLNAWWWAHSALWPRAGRRKSSLKYVSPSPWEHVPNFTGFIQGWIRKPLLHFGTTYSLLYLLYLRWAYSSVSAHPRTFWFTLCMDISSYHDSFLTPNQERYS